MSRLLQLTDRIVDLDTGEVQGHGTLRPTERALLSWLADHPGETFSLHQLHTVVWGYAPTVNSRAAYSCVNRIRALVEPDPRRPVHLLAQRSEGYLLAGARPIAGAMPLYTNVVPALDPFVGRAAELEALADRGTRMLAVVGPGGVGKSRLVREAALRSRLPGGVWVADAGLATEPAAVLEEVAKVLPGRTPAGREPLVGRLAELGPCWLVLDNLEVPAADVLEEWLARAVGCHLITTGRHRPGVSGERVLELASLTPELATELLLERVERRSSNARRSLSAAHIEALVAATDGLPLAIEIVAANVALVGARAVLDALDAGSRLPARAGHRAMDAVVESSWSRLTPPLRDALVALATLVAPFDVDMAAAALGVADATPVLADLTDQSLLTVDLRPDRPAEWKVLVTVRAFVRHVRPHPDEEILGRLAVALGARWERERGVDPIPCTRRPPFDAGLGLAGLRQLATWRGGSREQRILLLCALEGAAFDLGERAWCETWATEALSLDPAPWIVAELRRHTGLMRLYAGDHAGAEREWRASVDAALSGRRPGLAAHVQYQLTSMLSTLHRFDEALAEAAEIRRMTRELPPASVACGEGAACAIEAQIAQFQGRHEESDRFTAAAHGAYRSGGALLEAAQMLGMRAEVRLLTERYAEALSWVEQGVDLLETATNPARVQPLGELCKVRGYLLLLLGRIEESLPAFARSTELLRRCPAVDWLVDALAEEGCALGEAGRVSQALERLDAALRYPTYNLSMRVRRLYLQIARVLLADGVSAALELARGTRAVDHGLAPVHDRWYRQQEAHLRFALGDLEGAARVLDLDYPEVIRHPPSGAMLLRVEALIRLGRIDEAAAVLRALERYPIGPGTSAWIAAQRGLVAAIAGDRDTARSRLDDPAGTTHLRGGWIVLSQEWTRYLLTGSPPRTDRVRVTPMVPSMGWARAEAEGPPPSWLRG